MRAVILNYVSPETFRQSKNLEIKKELESEDEQKAVYECENGDGLQEAVESTNLLWKMMYEQ